MPIFAFMSQEGGISESSRRIARNSIALYVRMFVLMLVSLFTARIVLNALGTEDRGVYETVGSFVSMMSLLTRALSTAISRFLTVEMARSDADAMRKVFATAQGILLIISAAVLLVAEPLGIWYVQNVMNLPPGRTEAALWLFQFSLGTFLVTLLSIPFNASIFAHEKMGVYAVIGMAEGLLKLGVAIAILHAPFDRLVFYGLLLLVVAIAVRTAYVLYCRAHFPESRAGVKLERKYVGAMFGFAGWNGLSQGIAILNAHGVTQLVNYFFGVVFNTMRGLALNAENMVKQFIANVIVAINPQITKSYASGNIAHSSLLVCKGVKFAFLIGFTLSLPFFFEADAILHLWLGDKFVPEGTDLFTKLGLVCMILDISFNPLSTFVQAQGNIKRFYIMYSCVTVLVFPVTWLLFRLGCPPASMYLVLMADYLLLDILKLVVGSRTYRFPIGMFFKETLLRVAPVGILSFIGTWGIYLALPAGWWRLIAVLAGGTLLVVITTWLFALTPGEKDFALEKIRRK